MIEEIHEKINIEEIPTGEKIQTIAYLYFGVKSDFERNPFIKKQVKRHFPLHLLSKPYRNPPIVFCYSHQIYEFVKRIHFLKNDFVLITHNEDENIVVNPEIMHVLHYPRLKKWYAQNLCFEHEKIDFLPIGFANSHWPHGNLDYLKQFDTTKLHIKTKKVFFQFSITTNPIIRQPCFDNLKDKIPFLNHIHPNQNLLRLKEYEFCICPEGNGVDTHRLWECFTLKVVPIVLNSPFTNTLKKQNLPLVVLKSWDEYNESLLRYEDYSFETVKNITFSKIRDRIFDAVQSSSIA
jgi:hypothetical protein